jgi:CRP-like cAMP-binding protein
MNQNNLGTPVGRLLAYLKSKMQTELTAAFSTNIIPMLNAEILLKLLKLANPGDTLQTAFWLDSGYGRAYKILEDKEGLSFQRSVDFFKPERIMLDPKAFFEGLPGDCYFEIAKNSVIVSFTRENFNLLQLSAPEAQALATNILAANTAHAQEKAEMLTMKGKAKYDQFIRIFGQGIELHFAQKHIASYLGFTREYLNGLKAGK